MRVIAPGLAHHPHGRRMDVLPGEGGSKFIHRKTPSANRARNALHK